MVLHETKPLISPHTPLCIRVTFIKIHIKHSNIIWQFYDDPEVPSQIVWLQLGAVTHLVLEPHEEQVTRPLQWLLAICPVSHMDESLCSGVPPRKAQITVKL